MPIAMDDLPPLSHLSAAMTHAGMSQDACQALRQAIADVDRQLATAFHQGVAADVLIHRRGVFVTEVVKRVWSACLGELSGGALFAVGGFGRGLLFPHSDVDLLVLVRPAQCSQSQAFEHFFAALWDSGLKPGYALRDAEQCRQLVAEDLSAFTSLLDARYIAGDISLQAFLRAIVEDPTLWPSEAYLAARIAERDVRHARYNDTAYNLEPNLKDGPGGLRTLDMLRWLSWRLAHARNFEAMEAEGLLVPAESQALRKAEATLRRYRFALHLEAGRAEERLLFDYQRTLALQLGFVDEHAQNLGVEQFMQNYYRAASQVERLGVQIAERFEEMLEPLSIAKPVGTDFIRYGKRLAISDPDLFVYRPEALVEIFLARLGESGLVSFTADSMRRIHQATALHGPALAKNPAVLKIFLHLLKLGAPAVEALWRMNRHGLLAAILPAFGKVFGRMQYDLFHVYTVDEHTLRVLRTIAQFADVDAQAKFPMASQIWRTLDKPEILLLAALFHDIAKGRGGDHSVLGESDARDFCRALEMPQEQIELVAWLVHWHLLMSTTAQRQDITDPLVVQRFAETVGDWDRLDYLYLLTVADIIGTSPKLWNGWKDRLLTDLYTASRYALRRDASLTMHASARIHECRERAGALLRAENFEDDVITGVWAEMPEMSFLRHRPEQLAWQTAAIVQANGRVPVVQVHPLSIRGTTELFIYTPDRDGLFAAVTAVLDRMNFSVVEARILNSYAGMALDTFLLLESESQQPASDVRAEELQRQLQHILSQNAPISLVKRSVARQLKHFQRPPRIAFRDMGRRTQLALVCSDWPGLLATIAQVLNEAHIRVYDARIATFGERVEDFFEITDHTDAPLAVEAQERLLLLLLQRLGQAHVALRPVLSDQRM